MHDQLYEARVMMALALARDKAVRKRLPLEVARDIAQNVIIEQADNLFAEDWAERICSRTFEHIKEAVIEYEKEQAMKDKLRGMAENAVANEHSKATVRELAPTALTPREWQVIHRRYWHRTPMQDISVEIGVSLRRVYYIHDSGMSNMRLALRRLGITKGNWYRWYYEGQV